MREREFAAQGGAGSVERKSMSGSARSGGSPLRRRRSRAAAAAALILAAVPLGVPAPIAAESSDLRERFAQRYRALDAGERNQASRRGARFVRSRDPASHRAPPRRAAAHRGAVRRAPAAGEGCAPGDLPAPRRGHPCTPGCMPTGARSGSSRAIGTITRCPSRAAHCRWASAFSCYSRSGPTGEALVRPARRGTPRVARSRQRSHSARRRRAAWHPPRPARRSGRARARARARRSP